MTENGERRLTQKLDGSFIVERYVASQRMWVETDEDPSPFIPTPSEEQKNRTNELVRSVLADTQALLDDVSDFLDAETKHNREQQ